VEWAEEILARAFALAPKEDGLIEVYCPPPPEHAPLKKDARRGARDAREGRPGSTQAWWSRHYLKVGAKHEPQGHGQCVPRRATDVRRARPIFDQNRKRPKESESGTRQETALL